MKNILTVLILLFTQTINAQKVKTFFEIGINHNHAKENVFYDNVKSIIYKPGNGANIGLKVVTKIDEQFDFKIGLYMNYNTYKLRYTDFYYINLNHQAFSNYAEYLYFNLPLLLSYKVNKNIAINLGTGLNINSSIFREQAFLYYKNLYDIPLHLGITYRIKRTTFDIQYSLGNLPFDINEGFYMDNYAHRNIPYSTFFHRQLSINIGRCINRRSKTKWD